MNIFTPVQYNDVILLHGDKIIAKETLANFELFKGIPTDVLDKIAKFCNDIFVTKGGYVFREGELADKIHLLT